jgi:hypothetical protein
MVPISSGSPEQRLSDGIQAVEWVLFLLLLNICGLFFNKNKDTSAVLATYLLTPQIDELPIVRAPCRGRVRRCAGAELLIVGVGRSVPKMIYRSSGSATCLRSEVHIK